MQDEVVKALRVAMENDDVTIGMEDAFREYAEWDSLARMSLIAELDDRFGVLISSDDFEKLKTVGELVKEVERLRG